MEEAQNNVASNLFYVWDTPLSFHLSDCIDDLMLLPVKCSHVLPLPGLSLEKPAPFRSFQRTILLESIFEISLRPTFLKWPIISEVSPSCWFSRGVLWFTYAGYYEESHNGRHWFHFLFCGLFFKVRLVRWGCEDRPTLHAQLILWKQSVTQWPDYLWTRETALVNSSELLPSCCGWDQLTGDASQGFS